MTEFLCRSLQARGYQATGRTSPIAALDLLSREEFDVLITDMQMNEMNGIELLREALRIDSSLIGIVMTGNGAIDTAVAALQAGAIDYILKPLKLETVVRVVSRALELRGLRMENADLDRRLRQRVEELRVLNEGLEERINSRTRDLQNSLAETSSLLQEVHHRVRNNLQMIGSLLTLQAECSAPEQGGQGLREAHRRVWSLSVIQEQFDALASRRGVDFGQCVETLAAGLFSSHRAVAPGIRLEVSAQSAYLTLDQANPSALILQELLSNSLRHAYGPGCEGVVRIGFRAAAGKAELCIADDGIGLPGHLRPDNAGTLGLQLVHILSQQLKANVRIEREKGTVFTLAWEARV